MAAKGNDSIDLVSNITAWMELGTAPASAMTYRFDSSGSRTASRPAYLYPAVAQFTGSGDWHDGANYVSGAARDNVRSPSWPGAILYAPYTSKVQGVPAP